VSSSPISRGKIRNAYFETCIAARQLEEVAKLDATLLASDRDDIVILAATMRQCATRIIGLMGVADRRDLQHAVEGV